jgi:hypothetical protein
MVVEKFEITGIKPSARLNQGHYNNTLEGNYKTDTFEVNKGMYIIRTNQPLGQLAAYLLEPRSDDGYAFWNFFDKYIVPQWSPAFYPWPVYRINTEF